MGAARGKALLKQPLRISGAGYYFTGFNVVNRSSPNEEPICKISSPADSFGLSVLCILATSFTFAAIPSLS